MDCNSSSEEHDLSFSKIEILKEYPGREAYLKQLSQLFGYHNHCLPPSVFICGASGTGKTVVLLKLLKQLSISHALMDCIESYTPKLFYETIINCMQDYHLSSNNNFENYASCGSAEDFIDTLNASDKDKPYVIILKNFNRLHDIDANILPIMMRLNTLVPCINISCVLIGSKSKLDHMSKQGLIPCINIHCEQYSKNDLLKILSLQIDHLKKTMIKIVDEVGDSNEKSQKRQRLDELDDSFFHGYFDRFMSTFYSICRNAKELLYLSNANFPIYCKPVIDGEIGAKELRKLYKNMELPFKTAMNSIYCRVDQNHIQPIVSKN